MVRSWKTVTVDIAVFQKWQKCRLINQLGRASGPVSRAVFKTVGRREGVSGRFDSCLFRHYSMLFNSLNTLFLATHEFTIG